MNIEQQQYDINDYLSVSVTGTTKDMRSRETVTEDKRETKHFIRDRELKTVEAEGTAHENMDIHEKPKESFKLVDKKDNEIPAAADEAVEEGFKEEKTSNFGDDITKTINSTSVDSGESSVEKKDSDKKSEGRSTKVVVEKTALKLKGDQSNEHEADYTKNIEIPTDQNFESVQCRGELDSVSEIVTRDKHIESIPETSPREIEENSNDIKSQSSESNEERFQKPQGQNEMEENIELLLEADSKETQGTNEIIKVVILAAEVQEEGEKAHDDETADHPKENENDIKEIHTVSPGDGRVDAVIFEEESSFISAKHLERSNEQLEAVNSEVQEAKLLDKEALVENIGGREKPTGILTITGAEGSEEMTKGEVSEEAYDSYGKIKEAPTRNMASERGSKVTQIEKMQVQVFDNTKDDSSQHIDKDEASIQYGVIGNRTIGEASHLASQVKSDGHDNTIKERMTQEKGHIDMKESKKDSDEACESKSQDVEEHSGESKEDTIEASQTVSNLQIILPETGYQITASQALSEEIPQEQHKAETGLVLKDSTPSVNEENDAKGEILDEDIRETVEVSEIAASSNYRGPKAAKEDDDVIDQIFQEQESKEPYQTATCDLIAREENNISSSNIKKTEDDISQVEHLGDELNKTDSHVQNDKSHKAQGDRNLDEIKEKKELPFFSEDPEAVIEEIGCIKTTTAGTETVEDEMISTAEPAAILSKEQDHKTLITTESTDESEEAIKLLSSEPKTAKDASLQESETRELEVPQLKFTFDKGETKEPCELGSKSDSQESEPVIEAKLGSSQTLPENHSASTISLSKEEDRETPNAIEKKGEKSMDVEVKYQKEEEKEHEISGVQLNKDREKESPNEAPDEEAKTAGEASELQPQEHHSKIRDAESPPVNERITEISGSFAKIVDNKATATKEGSESALLASGHDVLPEPEKETGIKKKHPGAPMTEPKTEANQSHETIADTDIPHDEVRNEEVPEDGGDATDDQPITICEETEKNQEEYEPQAAECQGEMRKEIGAGKNKTVTESLPTEARDTAGTDSQEPEHSNVEATDEKTDNEAGKAGAVAAGPAKTSLSEIIQKSARERQMLAGSTEENEPLASKDRTETEPEKSKSDEDMDHDGLGEENIKTDSGSDAPVIVEASRDIDLKLPHKKSNNILAGVGSKVKHSISKVRKAITGKSSHPKQHSPK